MEKWNSGTRKLIGQNAKMKKTVPLLNAFVDYLEAQNFAVKTVTSHLTHLDYFLKFLADEDGSIETATVETIRNYQSWLMEYKTRFDGNLALSSQIHILSSLRVFYRTLEKLELIFADPAKNLRLPKEQKKLPTSILTSREVKRLLKQPDIETVSGFRDRAILELLYSCAPRISELIQLKESEVDVSDSSLHIFNGKGGKDRIVPIGKAACDYIAEYRANVRPLLLSSTANAKDEKEKSDILFLNRFGDKFGVSGLLKKLQKYARRARIQKRVTVHTFRHTLATEMLRGGAEISYVQRILGHSKLTTTQIYTHILKGELKKIQAKHHPREAINLPDGVIKYRGFDK